MAYEAGDTVGQYTLLSQRVGRLDKEKSVWLVRCSCGVESPVRADYLDFCRANQVDANCGHVQREREADTALATAYEMAREPTWVMWKSLVDRCTNTESKGFAEFGGAGVSMHAPWLESFAQFYRDMGPRPRDSILVRKPDKRGDYVPGNCEWVPLVHGAPNPLKR